MQPDLSSHLASRPVAGPQKFKPARKRHMASALMFGLAVGMVGTYLLLPSSAATNTTMYLSPASANVTVNANFSVAVRINAGEAINAVEANLNYNASQLQFVGISDAGSAFTTAAPSSGGGGSVTINRAQLGGVTGDQLVATVTFKALVANASSSVSFAGSSQALRQSDNGNDLSSASGGTYALKAVAVATPPPAATPPKTPAATPPKTPATTKAPAPGTAPVTPPSTTPPAGTPPVAATPTPVAPGNETVSPAVPTTVPKTTIVDDKASGNRRAVVGLSGLAVLVIAAVGIMLFFKRRAALAPAPGVVVGDGSSAGPQASVYGPAASQPPSATIAPQPVADKPVSDDSSKPPLS